MQRSQAADDQLTDELYAFLSVTMKATQGDVFRLVGELDLTMTQLKMLYVLDGMDRQLTQSELARIVGLSPADAGRAVDALTRQGIVSRRDDETDRRVRRVALTAAGQDMIDRISAARRTGLARFVAQLDPAQRDALSAALAPLLPSTTDCASPARAEDPR